MSEDFPSDDSQVIFKIIVPLKMVPDNGIVTKKTGQKRYVASRTIRIFGGPPPHKITPEEGTVFLQSGTDLNVYPETTEVVWHVPDWELRELLNPEPEFDQ